MDETFQQIDRRFERVDEELAALRHAIKNEDKARAALRCRSRENDRERNLVLDQSLATARQVIEVMASNAADDVMFERRLDDHDRRIDTIEQTRGSDPHRS